MTKYDIVDNIAKLKIVERVVSSMGSQSPYTEDLAQDIYEALLKKPDELVKSLFDNGQLTFYIIKMVKNNIFSKTSPFYRDYERYRKNADDLEESLKNDI